MNQHKSQEERSPYSAKIIKDASDKRLYQKTKKVTDIHSNQTFAIIDALRHKVKETKAVGIAAPQLGINRQIILVLNENTGTIDEFINPSIIEAHETNENMEWSIEGCLSHPGLFAEIARPNNIIFKAQRLQDTKPQIFHAAGFISRILQHEIDHLNGILFTDKGMYFRNPTFDTPGQLEHMAAVQENEGKEPQDFIVD